MRKGKIPLHLCMAFATRVGKHFAGRNMVTLHGNLLKSFLTNLFSTRAVINRLPGEKIKAPRRFPYSLHSMLLLLHQCPEMIMGWGPSPARHREKPYWGVVVNQQTKGVFLLLSVYLGSWGTSYAESPLLRQHGGLSSPPALVRISPQHPFPCRRGCHGPGWKTGVSRSPLLHDHNPNPFIPKSLHPLAAPRPLPKPPLPWPQVLGGSWEALLEGLAERQQTPRWCYRPVLWGLSLSTTPGRLLWCFHCQGAGKAPLGCLCSPGYIPPLPPLLCSIHEYISLSLFFFSFWYLFFFSLSHYPFNAEQGCWLQKRQFDSSNRSSSLILTVTEIPAATRIRGSIHICQL